MMHFSDLVCKFAVVKLTPRKMQMNPRQVCNYSKTSDDGARWSKTQSFMNTTSGSYVEEIYKAWKVNPASVHSSWDVYFRNVSTQPSVALKHGLTVENPASKVGETEKAKLKQALLDTLNKKRLHDEKVQATATKREVVTAPIETLTAAEAPSTPKEEPITLVKEKLPESVAASVSSPPPESSSVPEVSASPKAGGGGGGAAPSDGAPTDIEQHLAVQGVIRSYQARGHLVAQLDPLGILYEGKSTFTERAGQLPDVVARQHKDKLVDMEKSFTLPSTTFIGEGKKSLPLKEIIQRLETAYCRHIGAEYMYIHNMEELNWIRQKMEPPGVLKMEKEAKIRLLKRIARATIFEAFLAKKWSSEKRFGLEGGDVFIASLKQIIDTSTSLGVEAINLCMAHRGRLNVLVNVCGQPLKELFATFQGLKPEEEGSGDVKYHLGLSVNHTNSINKKKVRLCMIANPSHLECVSAVCLGKTKCEQFLAGDEKGDKTVAVIIHGDAAFSGQGIVYETLNLSYLPEYTTHGTIHIVINNQIGYTTDPRFSRSSPYCSDVGRVVHAPIFHVNSDDPESVMYVSKVAAEWRQTFKKDVVIDLVCYRRNGHNEIDEPMFTQPLMYQKIRKLPNSFKLYSDQLVKEKVMTQQEIDAYAKDYEAICEADFAKAKEMKTMKLSSWLDSPWKGFFKNFKFTEMPKTGISEADIKTIGEKFTTPPPGFVLHKGITRVFNNRKKMLAEKTTDWSLGEALAYTSLLKDGVHVRLSGQDVERGTFSHRHHIIHDQTKDKKTYNMLRDIFPNQGPYRVCNSALSEYGVLGFELGYAQVNPNSLVMWEAQFGDFFNGAQIMVDQFIASGQSKWIRQCGLVMQLPHGLEGMGPEHSSARLERFLQMCDDDIAKPPFDKNFVLEQHLNINWFVANCTTPASLFHLLRRQLKLPFRKPLVLMTPKGLLRNNFARSKFEEYLEGTEFQRLIPEKGPASKAPDQVKKLLFCSGKTYYDIGEIIAKNKVEGQIAVARLEQITPFPYDLVQAEIKKYNKAKVFWAQEEHKNSGSWFYARDRIDAAVEGKVKCEYIGRPVSAAPAAGNKAIHLKEIADYTADILKMP